MSIDLSKYAQKNKTKKTDKPPCTYIKFVEGEKGYGILAQLRQMGVQGGNLNRLVEDVLEQAITAPEEGKKKK